MRALARFLLSGLLSPVRVLRIGLLPKALATIAFFARLMPSSLTTPLFVSTLLSFSDNVDMNADKKSLLLSSGLELS